CASALRLGVADHGAWSVNEAVAPDAPRATLCVWAPTSFSGVASASMMVSRAVALTWQPMALIGRATWTVAPSTWACNAVSSTIRAIATPSQAGGSFFERITQSAPGWPAHVSGFDLEHAMARTRATETARR